MAEKTWKKRERQVAGDFGAERTPLSGGNGKQTRSDTLHPDLFIEHKHRKHHAVVGLYDDTAALAAKEGKIPLVTLSQHGRSSYLIVLDPRHLSTVARTYSMTTTEPTE